MRVIGIVLLATLFVIGCEGKGVKGWPPGEFKNADEAYPELPPVSIPGLTGLEDSPSLGYDLSQVKYLSQSWGSAAERRFMSENGFVVTDETYNQICSFYTHAWRPVFVTTDSLLYAYYVNVEEDLYRLELKQADNLKTLLRKVRAELGTKRSGYSRMPTADKLDKAAADLDAYLSVAEILTYLSDAEAIPAGTPAKQRKEIEFVLAAEGPAVSPLREVPLDYSRFEPRGLYAKEKKLSEDSGSADELKNRTRKLGGFYRAVSWLSDVPFRLSDENETLQALILADVDLSLGPEASAVAAFNAPYVEFLGPSDDLGITEYRKLLAKGKVSLRRWSRDGESLEKTSAALKNAPPPRHSTIPDPAAVKDPGLYGGLRFVPRPALYENWIFHALGPFGTGRLPPSGEEFFAVMGSRAAQEIVKGREARRVPEYDKLFPAAVAAAKEAEKTYTAVMCRKRRALYRSLIRTPEDPNLPRYYRHSAWRYKDLNTCLAGWAHHRYIWDLHGKRNIFWLEVTDNPPDGVVEANVEFFLALSELSRETGEYFTRYGITKHRFEEITAVAKELADIASFQLAGEALNRNQKRLLIAYGAVLANLCGFLGNSWINDEDLPPTPFCVPISIDMYTGNERVVGQARPRAIYVICEQDDEMFLAEGGVLSYRDWLGPAWGEGKMTEERWLESGAKGELKAPTWQEKFKPPELSRDK